MTDDQKKERLQDVLDHVLPPVHCNGCDPEMCNHDAVKHEQAWREVIEALLNEIKTWEQPQ